MPPVLEGLDRPHGVEGIEAGLDTILVLTGSTKRADVDRFPWRPGRVLDSIADAVELV